MALHPTGLGKGLDALIRETNEPYDPSNVRSLPLDDIIPNARQPRRDFSEKSLEELAASIKSQGVLQPLLVRPLGAAQPGKYEIVAGERRWRASRMAGLHEVPVLVRSFSQQDTLAAALIENLQREDLNPIEEAEGIRVLKEEFGLSQDDLAVKIGKSRSAIANTLRLLSLSDEVRQLLVDGRLTAGHARALLSVADEEAREQMLRKILDEKLSVREAEGLANAWKSTGMMGSNSGGSATPGKQKAPRPQSGRIAELQLSFEELYQVPVKITGRESKGKISFAFNSREELEALLSRLSGNVLTGQELSGLTSRQQTPLAGKNDPQLEAADMPQLNAQSMAALGGNEMAALDGADMAALDGNDMERIAHEAKTPLEGATREKLAPVERVALKSRTNEVLDAAPTRQAIAASSHVEEAPLAAVEIPASSENGDTAEDLAMSEGEVVLEGAALPEYTPAPEGGTEQEDAFAAMDAEEDGTITKGPANTNGGTESV